MTQESLEVRVEKFNTLSLPGQPVGMHMGTSYLVNDLWREIQRLQGEAKERAVGQDNEFNNFQDWTRTLAIYQKRTGVNTDLSKAYCVLGLTGEAGEVADQVKKILREGDLNGERRAKIKMELGDVLWYLARTADEFGFTLREIAMANIVKLEDRRNRDKLKGDGDER